MDGTVEESVVVQSKAITTNEVNGSSYFVLDRNVGKGDRRSDGSKMADFFEVGEGERLKKQRVLFNPSEGRVVPKSTVDKREFVDDNCAHFNKDPPKTTVNAGVSLDFESVSPHKATDIWQCLKTTMGREQTNMTASGGQELVECKESEPVTPSPPQLRDQGIESGTPCPPPVPDKGIRCAGRKRTSRLLWLHEFFRVYEIARSKNKFPWIYQALQFKVGAQLPLGVVQEMSDTMRNEIWVLGVCYVPVEYVRKFSKRVKGYMFHTELNDDDGDKALYGKCPEIVRVENCLKWHPMSMVSRDVPRIVHADDIKNRRVHVSGREMHFVCGTTAVEDLDCDEFRLSRLPRRNFYMYPEERSGYELNSATSMWEHIDGVFAQIRQSMRSARQGTSSATFSMPLALSSFEFWKVCTNFNIFLLSFDTQYITYLCYRKLLDLLIRSHVLQRFLKRSDVTRLLRTNK